MSTCASTSSYLASLMDTDSAYAPHLPEAGRRDGLIALNASRRRSRRKDRDLRPGDGYILENVKAITSGVVPRVPRG